MAVGEGTVYVLTQTVSDPMNQTRMFSPDRSERNVLGLTVGSRRSHTLPTLPAGLRVIDPLRGRLHIRASQACISLDAKQTCGRQGQEGCVSREQRSNLIQHSKIGLLLENGDTQRSRKSARCRHAEPRKTARTVVRVPAHAIRA